MRNLVLLFFLCVTSLSNAQDVRFGFKGGFNVSTLLNKDGVSPRMGFHIGGTAEFELTQDVYVQPELLFSTLGANEFEQKLDKSISLSYVTVPLMIKYYPKGGFCLELGPYAAFNMVANQGSGEQVIDMREEVNINGLDYGIGFGVNYILPNSINFGIRANIGSSDIYDNESEAVNIQNAFLQFSVGYFL